MNKSSSLPRIVDSVPRVRVTVMVRVRVRNRNIITVGVGIRVGRGCSLILLLPPFSVLLPLVEVIDCQRLGGGTLRNRSRLRAVVGVRRTGIEQAVVGVRFH